MKQSGTVWPPSNATLPSVRMNGRPTEAFPLFAGRKLARARHDAKAGDPDRGHARVDFERLWGRAGEAGRRRGRSSAM